MAEVTGFDLEGRRVQLAEGSLPYDTLIVAGGSHYSYFGHDDWRSYAPEVKSLESALATRARILKRIRGRRDRAGSGQAPGATHLRRRRRRPDRRRDGRPDRRARPRHAARRVPLHRFRQSRVVLIETFDRVLTAFPPSLSRKAARSLESLGVTLLLERTVVDDRRGGRHRRSVRRRHRAHSRAQRDLGGGGRGVEPGVPARRAVRRGRGPRRQGDHRAGPDPPRPPRGLGARRHGPRTQPRWRRPSAPRRRAGRDATGPLRSQARSRAPEGQAIGPFRYLDKGNLATIGRARAVADLHAIRLSGFPAWATWLVVHLFYLIGFQNRLIVVIRWFISFATRGRGARLITITPATEADRQSQRSMV